MAAQERRMRRSAAPLLLLGGAAVSCAPAFVAVTSAPRTAPARAVAPVSHVASAGPETGRSQLAGAAVAAASLLAANAARRARTARRAEEKGALQQLLGMKGAGETDDTPLWKIRLQLCKPVTWPPLIFGVIAGVCASGNFDWGQATGADYAKLLTCVLLSGPVLVGYTQTLNDWYDKDLDAINEPYRPIPSGRITEEEVWQQIYVLGGVGLAMALALDVWQGHWPPTVFAVAVVGVLMAYIYSAPPLKLKQNWITGCYALGSSYIALPWLAGQCTFGEVTPEIIALTLWYSVAAVGIAIVNDFKSVEGDKKLGLSSAPVVFGIDTAKYMAPAIKDTVQLTIVAYLLYIGEWPYALGLFCLIIPQVYFAKTLFIEDPLKNDVKYQGSSLPFFSIGTIVAASAIGNNPLH
ncbi:unnamed protein product [Effrenium voratum]|uniref:Chlorophyll synthase n=1 Tax=Effrenium voratum TaxID=2562239 RepID=A0AA36JD86_9DINO|nr:unnamed protein product [Effrenium voratum]CAJ1403185.1 unnamed protein product [Effrenium voratum]|mmetsp:Transcript_12528/g.29653  ORF Transcript_12528/g.29653 Transcript_12528/m.29653 type:complete len:409 (-) Transcript_12528:41-1267(-)